ncbi:hypothetical protein EW146_g1647 [Bondarzewia mesenterica]|uniref:Zn(2)-C6 fungal-type domain-containing protein n=1 Tax=Bondarzewia mesenterica TaxID=1095465 RepID=A0A4S4M3M3_9AGAM|nr:hypothetical protein EW146_g1647 [Bondarzewia mesenterica]
MPPSTSKSSSLAQLMALSVHRRLGSMPPRAKAEEWLEWYLGLECFLSLMKSELSAAKAKEGWTGYTIPHATANEKWAIQELEACKDHAKQFRQPPHQDTPPPTHIPQDGARSDNATYVSPRPHKKAPPPEAPVGAMEVDVGAEDIDFGAMEVDSSAMKVDSHAETPKLKQKKTKETSNINIPPCLNCIEKGTECSKITGSKGRCAACVACAHRRIACPLVQRGERGKKRKVDGAQQDNTAGTSGSSKRIRLLLKNRSSSSETEVIEDCQVAPVSAVQAARSGEADRDVLARVLVYASDVHIVNDSSRDDEGESGVLRHSALEKGKGKKILPKPEEEYVRALTEKVDGYDPVEKDVCAAVEKHDGSTAEEEHRGRAAEEALGEDVGDPTPRDYVFPAQLQDALKDVLKYIHDGMKMLGHAEAIIRIIQRYSDTPEIVRSD